MLTLGTRICGAPSMRRTGSIDCVHGVMSFGFKSRRVRGLHSEPLNAPRADLNATTRNMNLAQPLRPCCGSAAAFRMVFPGLPILQTPMQAAIHPGEGSQHATADAGGEGGALKQIKSVRAPNPIGAVGCGLETN